MCLLMVVGYLNRELFLSYAEDVDEGVMVTRDSAGEIVVEKDHGLVVEFKIEKCVSNDYSH